ncbi:hypothetical protein BOX15_Mlig020874g2 [Macrostomum lignano]|uniref:RCK N-terminal domain-containing protein n=1 Tax=Macrostomum lignano TaxID=282301 RepID=A0A267GSG3_9PLAT|nr:hypothetical protein BOX15_Mlig020874g2 [Macrostomum lignano]
MSGTAAPSNSSAATDAPTTASKLCDQTEWRIIIGVTLATYFAFLIVIALAKFACAPVTRTKEDEQDARQRALKVSQKGKCTTQIHLHCKALMKGANIFGKIMLIIYSFCVVTSFVLYVRLDYYFYDDQIPSKRNFLSCFTASQAPIVHADFGINIFYAVVFVIRLVASNSTLSFWLTMDTMADHVTLLPSLIMYILNRHLLAFQYARLVGLRFIVNTLIYCSIIRGEKYIRLFNLLIQIISVWLISAGFFQLIEGVGDFWLEEGLTSAGFISFHDCFYFLLITMSTVGYGDISPRTILGKFFIILFVVVALGMFTRIIPEISEILTESKKYRRNRVHLKHGKSHVVVIGNFTVSMLNTFFNDFYHEERSARNREFVALLGEEEPTLDLKAVMKTRELYVTYLQGNVMSVKDLHRAEVKYASAVIIMADQLAKDQEDEDMKNIMRVIAIKDYCPEVKILVQLQLYRSKTYLRNIPDWGQEHGDQSVCINEIKYGILAQSCMVPGISTLLCNLLMLRSCSSMLVPRSPWCRAYLQGVEFEFYKVPFAPEFRGLNFLQACRICYEQLGIILLAIEETQMGEVGGDDPDVIVSKRTIINPGVSCIIDPNIMEAFVIAKDLYDARRITKMQLTEEMKYEEAGTADQVTTFGNNHADGLVAAASSDQTVQLQRLTSRSTDDRLQRLGADLPSSSRSPNDVQGRQNISTELQPGTSDQIRERSKSSVFHESFKQTQPKLVKLDSSGYFHWVPNRAANTILLSATQRYHFRNHVVVCVLERNPDVLLNITSFIMPLRASSIPRAQLKDIVFVGSESLIFNEWSIIQNFPNIYVLNGSPLNRANLKAVNIEYVDSCVILSPKANSLQLDAQVDRETVLCTLNIKTMRHPETGHRLGDVIHIITELNTEDSIDYLDQDDDDDVEEPYMTQAFATGRTFFHSLLGSIVTTIYFNGAALNFLRTVVTTVDSDNLEVNLNEQGFHFMSPDNQEQPREDCNEHSFNGCRYKIRSQIQLLELSKPPLSGIFQAQAKCSWKDLFMQSLLQLEIVCIGIFRLQVEDKTGSAESVKNHRFVVTLPEDSMELKESDKVYCLTPPTPQAF